MKESSLRLLSVKVGTNHWYEPKHLMLVQFQGCSHHFKCYIHTGLEISSWKSCWRFLDESIKQQESPDHSQSMKKSNLPFKHVNLWDNIRLPLTFAPQTPGMWKQNVLGVRSMDKKLSAGWRLSGVDLDLNWGSIKASVYQQQQVSGVSESIQWFELVFPRSEWLCCCYSRTALQEKQEVCAREQHWGAKEGRAWW